MKTITDKRICTGCSACYASCPNGSIEMVSDNQGFLYPEILGNCIDCGKCQRVCPRLNQADFSTKFSQTAYAAVSKDFKIWNRSSSGGAFSEICFAWGADNTMFCGALWDKLSVKHVCVIGIDKIAPLCKSKYVSSDLENCHKQIREHLGKGYKVLFCGTPCQVAGLKSFLNRDYDNLLLIDLICHGVGSPAVFSECIKSTEKDFHKKIASYEFRSKKKVFDQDHIVKLVFEGDTQPTYITEDRYLQLFVKQHCLKSSCGENCIYRNEHRQGDITSGDFKGLTKVFPQLDGSKKNYSTIVFNTQKGEKVFSKLKDRMDMLPCSVEDIKQYNPLFHRHTYFSVQRNNFFNDFIVDAQGAIEKWTVPAKVYTKSLKGKVFDILPQGVRRYFNKRRNLWLTKKD